MVLFVHDVERGNLVFKMKKNNVKNILIDDTIPTMNSDGWYKGDDKEWNKFTYNKDFVNYFIKLSEFSYSIDN